MYMYMRMYVHIPLLQVPSQRESAARVLATWIKLCGEDLLGDRAIEVIISTIVKELQPMCVD